MNKRRVQCRVANCVHFVEEMEVYGTCNCDIVRIDGTGCLSYKPKGFTPRTKITKIGRAKFNGCNNCLLVNSCVSKGVKCIRFPEKWIE